MRPMARTPPSPDYRSDKMESLEGKAIARGRVLVFWDAVDPDVLAETSDAPPRASDSWMPEEVRSHVSRQAVEESELIGFWVAWHRSGGFQELEHSGWHRATIFRKIRRFRAAYGVHPDEWQPDWIKLDTTKVWRSQLGEDLAMARGSHPSPD
jgi:hypothetical protein